MKKLLYILCLVTLACNLIGCDFQRDVQPAQEEKITQDAPEDANQSEKDKKDSIEEAQVQDQERIAKEEQKITELQTNLLAYRDSVNSIQQELTLLKSDTKSKSGKGITYILLVSELFLLLAGLFYLLSRIEGVEKRVKQWKNNAQGDAQKSPNNPQPWKIQSHEREISELKTTVNTLKKRIEALEKKLAENKTYDKKSYDNQTVKDDPVIKESNENKSVPTETSQIPEEQVKPSQPTNPRVFYMPRTSEQNRFDDAAKKYVSDDKTYFKFTLKPSSSDKADFVIDVDDSHKVRKSWDARNETILTVCEITSSVSDPKGCRNVIPGEAELRGNVWYVTKKAKIIYY